MRNVKPVLSSRKNFYGILHFEVGVDCNSMLYISRPFTPCRRASNSRHSDLGPFAVVTMYNDGNNWRDRQSLHDMGVDLDEHYDNQHRTFRFNVNDYNYLNKMVQDQDLENYLKLINSNVTADYLRGRPRLFDSSMHDYVGPEDFEDIPEEPNPFKVGDVITLNGSDDTNLVALGFKKRKHYTILNMHEKDGGLIQVDDKNAAPGLDNYVHHRFFKLIRSTQPGT